MSSITISADQLESCAARVSTLKTEMENTFNSTRSLIQGMNAYWQSPAANDAFAQFEQLMKNPKRSCMTRKEQICGWIYVLAGYRDKNRKR